MAGAVTALVAIFLVGWFVWHGMQKEPTQSADLAANDGDASPANRVRLSDIQTAEAGIEVDVAASQDLQLHRTLPARFVYDDTRHVALRTSTGGVLQSVLVKVGDLVNQGQVVAILRSPAIGDARGAVLAAESEMDLATKTAQWKAEISRGVKGLVQAIESGMSPDQIKQSSGDQNAGQYGGELLMAYSQSRLASKNAGSVDSIGGTGAISGRVVRERHSQQQESAANLEATIQQTLFDTEQALRRADAEVAAAERKVRLAKQMLATLIGRSPESADGLDVSPNDPDVSLLEIRSPIQGTVERRMFSATERVSPQDELFVIADATRLWVEADIRGRDWNSIRAEEGDTVMVTVPSVELPPQSATVSFIGRQVDPQSGAIPLVAAIDNREGRFRPGQFARVSVPTEKLASVIVVPSSAIVDLDGQTSVFVRDGQGYVAAPVVVGEQSDDQVEIREGIGPGQVVVTGGAFLLKSELLLEGEE